MIYEETRRATPDVPVVAISMSGGLHLDYMRRALGAGLDKHMDIASLHLYEIGNPVGDRSIERKTRLFKEVLQEHDLGHLPIWNTESGSNTSIRQDGVIVDQEELNRQIHQHPDFDPSTPFRIGNNWRASSELLGTAKVIRASYQQFAMGVEKNFMYQWGGSPHHYWVYDYDGDGNPMPKIKVVAAAMMSKMLRDYGPDPTPEQPNVESLKEGWLPFGHRFAGPGGRMIIVYVHPSETDAGPGDQLAALATGDVDATLEQASQHSEYLRTEKPEPVAVRVPVSADRAIVMDMFGRDRETVEATGGSVEIDATEIPQYVLEME